MGKKRTGGKYEAILEAAVRVIAEYGYHNAQVSKIAREAQVADGTIYLYFDSKDDVLISLFEEKMGAFNASLQAALEPIASPVEQLRELIRLHFRHLNQDHPLAVVTQIELRQSNPVVRKGIGKTLKQYLNIIDRIVIKGVEEGYFRADLDVRVTRKMIFGTIDETVTSWIMNDHKYNLTEQVEEIHRLFVNGIGKSL